MLLNTDIWVSALIRRVELAGSFATVERRGDPNAGAVLVKALDRRAGQARLYEEVIRGDAERAWMQPLKSLIEAELDAYIVRAVRIDPDLWVVEIDDTQGRHFLVEHVESP